MSVKENNPNEVPAPDPGWSAESLADAMPAVYADLKRIAASYLRHERQGHSLTPTTLVHEAYIRLMKDALPDPRGPSHFIALAARVMRRLLVERARAVGAQKRGGDWERITLHDRGTFTDRPCLELLALEEALVTLESLDPRQCRVVEMKFFGGLRMAEIAEVLNVAKRSVENDWMLARAWLRRRLASET